jgi:uncharacterized protein (DUF1330 family)
MTVALALVSATLCDPVIAQTTAPVAVPAASKEKCATFGYIVAMQGVGGAATPFSRQWQRAMKQTGAVFLLDEVPAWTYEGPQHWGRVTVARWPCFEQAEAVWKALPLPAGLGGDRSRLHTAALYRGKNYGSWPPGSLELPPKCTRPVYFMSVNTTYDEAQYGKYKAALMKTTYVQKLGSTTLLSGAPAASLPNWPADTTASMTHWPCKAAFEAFYLDPVYTNTIRPLRKGAIDYRIIGFPDTKLIPGD